MVTSRAGRILVLNAGSATLKATVLDLPGPDPVFERTVDWSPADAASDVGGAVDAMIDAVAAAGMAPTSIDAVGHRIVHGGERFRAPTLVDQDTLGALEALADLAPLHNPAALATIRAAQARLPSIPHVGLFDTSFHATLPSVAHRYPIPDGWVERFGIRRFGFHGLSVEWSVGRTGELLERPIDRLRLVVAHLGGGCSVTAVDAGRSIDTSMGLTPLEGLMMATRAGSIDPGIVLRLLRAGMDADEIERGLDHDSGLRGVGGTDDMRQLLDAQAAGDDRAGLAIELFVRRAAAGIAAAATTMSGLDAITFTGGIGEHAHSVRAAICDRLRLMGVPALTPSADISGDAVLARVPGGIAVVVVHAREDLVIAKAALEAMTTGPT